MAIPYRDWTICPGAGVTDDPCVFTAHAIISQGEGDMRRLELSDRFPSADEARAAAAQSAREWIDAQTQKQPVRTMQSCQPNPTAQRLYYRPQRPPDE
jgi:hypothetical protein